MIKKVNLRNQPSPINARSKKIPYVVGDNLLLTVEKRRGRASLVVAVRVVRVITDTADERVSTTRYMVTSGYGGVTIADVSCLRPDTPLDRIISAIEIDDSRQQ